MSRIVTVFGATGTQGASVVNALLVDGTFTPRAVTRNVDSDASKRLKARGIAVVQGNLSDKESIKKAIAGSEGVFGVTNTADTAGRSEGLGFEIAQGKNLVDACKETNVTFFVWSSLPSINKLSNGKYKQVAPFDNKAIVDEYLQTSGIPYAILHTSGFAENIYNRFLQRVDTPSGPAYEFVMVRTPRPATSFRPMVWIGNDLGKIVLALLKNYQSKAKEILGQTFTVVSEVVKFDELVKVVQEAIGKPVTYKSIETSGIAAIDEMSDFLNEFRFDYATTMKVDPRLVALGVKFSTMKEFAEEELKPRYA